MGYMIVMEEVKKKVRDEAQRYNDYENKRLQCSYDIPRIFLSTLHTQLS